MVIYKFWNSDISPDVDTLSRIVIILPLLRFSEKKIVTVGLTRAYCTKFPFTLRFFFGFSVTGICFRLIGNSKLSGYDNQSFILEKLF